MSGGIGLWPVIAWVSWSLRLLGFSFRNVELYVIH